MVIRARRVPVSRVVGGVFSNRQAHEVIELVVRLDVVDVVNDMPRGDVPVSCCPHVPVQQPATAVTVVALLLCVVASAAPLNPRRGRAGSIDEFQP